MARQLIKVTIKRQSENKFHGVKNDPANEPKGQMKFSGSTGEKYSKE